MEASGHNYNIEYILDYNKVILHNLEVILEHNYNPKNKTHLKQAIKQVEYIIDSLQDGKTHKKLDEKIKVLNEILKLINTNNV